MLTHLKSLEGGGWFALPFNGRAPKGFYDGKITGNFPVIQIAAKNKAPEQMAITNVFDWKENTVIVTASPLGILQLILHPGTTERTGLMEVGPFKTSFQLKKL